MIRHMIKQTNHKPQWHVLIDINMKHSSSKFVFVLLCCHGNVVSPWRIPEAHLFHFVLSQQIIRIPGTLCKKSESGIFGTHFLKMHILRFHDLITKIGIAKIGIAKIGIPILVIHPDRDPNFSNPNFSDSHTLLTWWGERRKFYYSHWVQLHTAMDDISMTMMSSMQFNDLCVEVAMLLPDLLS